MRQMLILIFFIFFFLKGFHSILILKSVATLFHVSLSRFLKLQYDVTLHQVDYPNEHFENCKKSKPDFLVPGAFYYLRFLKVNQSFFQWMPNTLPSPWLEIKGKLEFGVAANNKVFHSNILIRVDLKGQDFKMKMENLYDNFDSI